MRVHSTLAVAFAAVALAAPAVGQNLLSNPGFDTGITGWYAANYSPQWNSLDANGSAKSGSARATVPGGGPQGGPALTRCLPVTAGTRYALSIKARFEEPGYPLGELRFYPAENCTGSLLAITEANGSPTVPPGSWYTGYAVLQAPAGSHSAYIALSAATKAGGAAQTVSWDDVYFGPAAPDTCPTDATTLCLDDSPGDHRFAVRALYSTTQGGGVSGAGQAIALSSLGVTRGGLFWFFAADNPEALVKVLDGCPLTHFFWVFVSAGTNVHVDLYVGDTTTGGVAFFHNPDRAAFPAIQSTLGLPCAPGDL